MSREPRQATRNGQRAPLNRRGVLAGCCFCALVTVHAGAALAQDDGNSAEIAAARAMALDGIKLADAGRCGEAVDKLARAERLHHAPVVLGRLGECQVLQGKLVEGTENLRKVLREPFPPNTTAVLLKARDRAQAVLDAAKPRIASTTVSIKGPHDTSTASITFDGQPMAVALLDAERPTDPGEHAVEASAPGYLKASARVSVNAGEKQTVTLRLEPDPSVGAGAASVSSPLATSSGAPASKPLSAGASMSASSTDAAAVGDGPHRAPAYVTWALGGAAIVGGSVFGAMAMKGKSDLESDCPGNVCSADAQGRLDAARRASTISNVLFAVGGAGLVVGAVLYFTAGASAPSASSGALKVAGRASTTDANATRASAWLGVGAVGVSGQF